jgi:hypothetical protein
MPQNSYIIDVKVLTINFYSTCRVSVHFVLLSYNSRIYLQWQITIITDAHAAEVLSPYFNILQNYSWHYSKNTSVGKPWFVYYNHQVTAMLCLFCFLHKKKHKYTIPKHKLQSQNTMFSVNVRKLPDLYFEYNCGVTWCKLLTQLNWVCCLAWLIVPPWAVVCSGARRIGSPQESRQFRWLSTKMLPVEARH